MRIADRSRRLAAWLLAAAAFAATGCTDRTGDEAGLDMRSRGTGESNERLGNDPAEQNTGEQSTGEEIGSEEPPPEN